MKLKAFIQLLETIAPPNGAAEWDNTGVLIEPLHPRDIQTVLLTIDLTEAVAREAVRRRVDFIIAYHPLFFGSLHALQQSDPQARTAMRLIENGIGVYSPHTALDSAPGGVNDWLAGLFDGTTDTIGSTRIVTLSKALALPALAAVVKQKLGLDTIQTAPACGRRPIQTVALCAGSGEETLRGIHADCYLTGEMKHHAVLAAVQRGIHVILCGHTETERGYLPVLGKTLRNASSPALKIIISASDRAPLKTLIG